MSKFDPAIKDWHSYVERLDFYCDAEIASPEKKRAVFLSICGARTYQLVRNLVSLAKPAEKTYNEIVELLNKFYSPKPSLIMQCRKFNSRARAKDESVAAYIAALQRVIIK